MPAVVFVFIVCCLAGKTLATDKKAEIAYVKWAEAIATAHLAEAVLEEKMGYDIELKSLGVEAMWQAIAAGDIDATTCAWLPGTHGSYLADLKDKVNDLGANLEGARIGLVVPEYVEIDSIKDLNANAEKFKNKIIGIDSGAGIMARTQEAIRQYEIDNMNLIAGSDASMTAILEDKIDKKQWVVVTGWTPHWMFGKWELKYLDDPLNVFGACETINTIVRKGLKNEKPDLYAFLSAFKLSLDDLHEIMCLNYENPNPGQNALKWIKENPEKINKWLP
jgi:glycine betaine/proline transport system substrate-binding protein